MKAFPPKKNARTHMPQKGDPKTRTGALRPVVYRFRPLAEIGRGVSFYPSVPPFRYRTTGAVNMKEVIAREFSKLVLNGQNGLVEHSMD